MIRSLGMGVKCGEDRTPAGIRYRVFGIGYCAVGYCGIGNDSLIPIT